MDYKLTLPDNILIEPLILPPTASLPPQVKFEYYSDKSIVWIAPKNNTEITGSGTLLDPYRVSSSEEFDNVFKNHFGSPTHFRLFPGDYYTKGNWNFPEQGYCYFGSNSSIEGHKPSDTTIHLADDAIFETNGVVRKDANLFWAGEYYSNGNNISIKNLTFNGHCEKFGKSKYISGIRLFSNNSNIDSVIIKEIRGSFEENIEAFGISVVNHDTGPWQGSDGGTLISNCIVTDVPSYSYVSAFSVGYRNFGRKILPSKIENCKAFSNSENHFAFSGCCQVTVKDCYCEGVNYGMYNDTDDADGWLLDGNTFNCHYGGVTVISTQSNKPRKNIRCINNIFNYSSKKSNEFVGLSLVDTVFKTPFSNIILENNHFYIPTDTQNKFVLVSINTPQLKTLRLMNNVIPQSSLQNVINTPSSEINILRNWSLNGGMMSGILPPLK